MGPLNESSWHHLSADHVVAHLESHSEEGLNDDEAAQRQERHGLNVLTACRGLGPLARFFLQFHQPLIYILLAAAVITSVLRQWVDCSVILGVVLANAAIGFVQETKALSAINALLKTLTTEATVVRAGRKLRIPSADVVPGDILLLKSGDKVAADVRLLRCRDLHIAEAALTGESIPVGKSFAPLSAGTMLAERKNMAYASTLVTYGQGAGVVVATGDSTEFGRISQLIQSADDLQTPLTRRIAHFSKVLLVLILGLAAINFVVGWVRGETAVEMFLASVALAVAAIPEALPAAVTITLAIGASRMARRRAIIRKLPAVEALGSTTVICSDKTGTLTENKMTVTEIVAGREFFRVTGVGYSPAGDFFTLSRANDVEPSVAAVPTLIQLTAADIGRRTVLLECLRAGTLCNDSLLREDDGRWYIQGDPTEGTLIVAGAKAGLNAKALHVELPRVDAIPFESEHQYMATLQDQGLGKQRMMYFKGSVESVLQRCTDTLDSLGRNGTLNQEAIHAQVADMASRGLRVLAFARKQLPAAIATIHHADVKSGLTFLGLQGMIDPPRS